MCFKQRQPASSEQPAGDPQRPQYENDPTHDRLSLHISLEQGWLGSKAPGASATRPAHQHATLHLLKRKALEGHRRLLTRLQDSIAGYSRDTTSCLTTSGQSQPIFAEPCAEPSWSAAWDACRTSIVLAPCKRTAFSK
eukprot:jgi/Botrbrau1/22104/Bobra.0206s0030.1